MAVSLYRMLQFFSAVMIWELDFASRPDVAGSLPKERRASAVRYEDIDSLCILHWREHCLECSPPQCYKSCQLYVRRRDQRCARLVYGIYPNRTFEGLLDYGADVRFRRWGNVMATLRAGAATPLQVRRLDRLNRMLLAGVVNPVAAGLAVVDRERWANRLFVKGREALLRRVGQPLPAGPGAFDELLIEAWNMEPTVWKLMLEVRQNENFYRDALTLTPGHNLHSVPFHQLNLDLSRGDGSVKLFPENDAEMRVVFTWASFVRRRRNFGHAAVLPGVAAGRAPAPKLKCVVWDLDNTLWSGILLEDGADNLRLRPEAVALVKALDERGIVQSVASKNDFDVAWNVVRKHGLDEYFLYPAIHWGQKSQSLRWIAEKLNIGIDTFALIDDSAFERAEVGSVLPEIRTYSELEIESLLGLDAFDVQITEASRTRRLSYMANASRERFETSFGANYLTFLRSCELEIELFTPVAQADLERCFELVMRTNQLNLTAHRYSESAFHALLADEATLAVAWRAKDRFGDYGIVGFASIIFGERIALLKDFLLSCRVARKKVENAWFQWACARVAERGSAELRAQFRATERNGVLLDVLREVGFSEIGGEGGVLELTLPSPVTVSDHDVVAVRVRGRPGEPAGKAAPPRAAKEERS